MQYSKLFEGTFCLFSLLFRLFSSPPPAATPSLHSVNTPHSYNQYSTTPFSFVSLSVPYVFSHLTSDLLSLGTSSPDINHPKQRYMNRREKVKKAVLNHSRKLSLTHLEADPLESCPGMELCQTQPLPIVVITAITADANVNSALICMGKLQIFDTLRILGEFLHYERRNFVNQDQGRVEAEKIAVTFAHTQFNDVIEFLKHPHNVSYTG